MTMKTPKKISRPRWLLGLSVAAVLILAVLFAVDLSRKRPSGPESEAQTGAKGPFCPSWPIYRAETGLTGRVEGSPDQDKLTLKWTFRGGSGSLTSPVIENGRVYFADDDGRLYAIGLHDGKPLWRVELGDGFEAPPCGVQGKIIVGALSGTIWALAGQTGTVLWKKQIPGKITGSANYFTDPASGHTCILIPSHDSKLYCLDLVSGDELWQYESGSYLNAACAVTDEWAVVGGCDHFLHVVRLADGGLIRQVDTGSFVAGAAAVADGKGYLGNYEGDFLCVDLQEGTILWRYQNPQKEPFFSSPAVGKDCVIVGCRDHKLYCIDRQTGEVIWTFLTGGEVDSSAVICGDRVIIGADDGWVYLLEVKAGKEQWSYQTNQSISTSGALAEGMVVIAGSEGFVYGFAWE